MLPSMIRALSIRWARLLPVLLSVSFMACGPKSQDVETVPASILDPGQGGDEQPAKRVEYEIVSREDTPIFPAPDNAQSTGSGLRFVVFKRGENMAHPVSTTNVTVHYQGYTSDSKIFDSSIQRGEPTSFALNQVIPGWREGVKLMTVGDQFRFWIPEKDAYRGAAGKPAGLLIFDVELIEMESE